VVNQQDSLDAGEHCNMHLEGCRKGTALEVSPWGMVPLGHTSQTMPLVCCKCRMRQTERTAVAELLHATGQCQHDAACCAPRRGCGPSC
jgi:hypothetical protein